MRGRGRAMRRGEKVGEREWSRRDGEEDVEKLHA